MFKKTFIGLALILGLFAVVVAMQPSEFHVERSATLAASPSALFEHVNDPRKFNVWNPFMKMDPETKNTFSGPTSGVGAACHWDGEQTGEGISTIIESKPGELVKMRMDWIKPMEGTSTVDFTFRPEGDQTVVTWAMYGHNNFMAKAISLFMSCEDMCGPPFEQGLKDLGAVAASSAQ